MKYTIFGFQQSILVEHELTINDAAILEYICGFIFSGAMKKLIVGGLDFFWLDYQTLSDNFPIFHVGHKSDTERSRKKRVINCIDNLCKANVLIKYIKKTTTGTDIYVSVNSEMWAKLTGYPVLKREKSTKSGLKPSKDATTKKRVVPHNQNKGCVISTTKNKVVLYNDDSLINNSLINNSEFYKTSFKEFWNKYGLDIAHDACMKLWFSFEIEIIEKIMKSFPNYIKATPDIKYRKFPLNWLQGKHWNDTIPLQDNPPIEINPLKDFEAEAERDETNKQAKMQEEIRANETEFQEILKDISSDMFKKCYERLTKFEKSRVFSDSGNINKLAEIGLYRCFTEIKNERKFCLNGKIAM